MTNNNQSIKHMVRLFENTMTTSRNLLLTLVFIIYSSFNPLIVKAQDPPITIEEVVPEGGAEVEDPDSVEFRGERKYPSLMWEITGPGMSKPSYLYGSMHVSRKLAFHLGDTFFMAIKSVDVVALESNPAEWMEHYTNSPYYRNRITTRSNHLNRYQYRNFYRDMFYPSMPEVKTFSELLSKRYNVMNHMLYRKSEAMSDFEEKTYLDLFIFQAGAKSGKRMIGLEDFEISRQMVEEAETRPKKREEEKKLTRDQSKMQYRYGEVIEEAYRRGDLDLLDSVSRMMDPYPKYHTWMIVKRNEVMANTIDSVIRSGSSIFAACGAAHLPGDSGVIEMLRWMGYTLRPVTRTINKSQHKHKEMIDKQIVKVNYQVWSSPEGDFSVEIPGKFYSSVFFSEHGEYFYPDMINGSYYVVNRFPTFAPLRGQHTDQVKTKFDSLIYEFIPGKINHFHETNIGGFPAYDIRSTTSRGDMQQYKIVFTPLEVFVFKMSGPGDYLKREKSSQRFFSSIQMNVAKDAGWKRVTQHQWGFSLELPSYHIIDTSFLFNRNTKDMLIHAYDKTDSSYYMVIKGSYYDFAYIEEDSFELNILSEQLAEQFEMKISSRLPTIVSGFPALDVSMKNADSTLRYHARIVLAGPAYYLFLTTASHSGQIEKFRGGISITAPAYDPSDFYVHKDTTMCFSVSTVVDPPEMKEAGSGYYSYWDEDEDEDKSHLREDKSTYFFNHRSVELIRLDYVKYHKYRGYFTLNALWDEVIRQIDKDSTMIVRDRIQSDSGMVNTLAVTFTDTNSSRAILVKFIQRHGALYRLSTITDTILGPSGFVTRFFDSFTPFDDTLIGWSVFGDKGKMYLEDLVSEDSTTRAQARKSINIIRFGDEHFQLLSERISNPVWDEQTFGFRSSLISDLGRIKHPDIPAFLHKLYIEIGDTVTLQFAILKTLSRIQTEAGIKHFLQCLKTDLPLSSNSWDIDYIFTQLQDSLKITRHLFPEIFAYTRYAEYEHNIYQTLAILADSGLIRMGDYQQEYDIIFRNARDAWKRHLAREEEDQDKRSEYYTGSSSWSKYGGSYSSRLGIYLKLILPWYQREAAVRKLVHQVQQSRTPMLQIDLVVLMLQQGLPVSDSLKTALSKDPSTMFLYYQALATGKQLSHFDTTGFNQQLFSMSLLSKEANLRHKDSLTFVGKRSVSCLKGEGFVYFFTKKKDKEKYSTLCWVGLLPADSTKAIHEDYIKNSSGSRIYDNDNLEELMEKEMKRIRLMGRKRAEGMRLEKDTYQYLWY
jgi:uncharacterized protein YbaP (TraB family)